MTTKYWLIACLACLLIGIAANPSPTAKEEIRFVEKIREVSQKETTENKKTTEITRGPITKTRKVTKPDGTKVETTETVGPTTEKSSEVAKTQTKTEEKVKETEKTIVKINKPRYIVGALINPLKYTEVTAVVGMRVLGNLYLISSAKVDIKSLGMPSFGLGIQLSF